MGEVAVSSIGLLPLSLMRSLRTKEGEFVVEEMACPLMEPLALKMRPGFLGRLLPMYDFGVISEELEGWSCHRK